MSKAYKIGDLLRYDIGPTALMEVTNITEYDTGLRRYYGKQCMGGSTAAGCDQVRLASRDDLATWRKYHPEESVPEAAPASVPVAVTEDVVKAAGDAFEKWMMGAAAKMAAQGIQRSDPDSAMRVFRHAMRAALIASGIGDGAGWVPVKTRRPDTDGRYLVWDEGFGACGASIFIGHWSLEQWAGLPFNSRRVTAWRPLPSPPAAGG